VSAHSFHRHTMRLAGPILEKLQGRALACRVTWPDILVALVSAYCRRFMGTAEAVVGVPHMGRLGSKAARVPCTLMNVLPLRVAVDEDEKLPDFFARIA